MTFPGLIKTDERTGYDERAIGKLRALVESARICMFTTSLLQWPLESRPADWQAIDDNGDIWLFNGKITTTEGSPADSDTVVPHVQVFYSNADRSEFLSLIGNATVTSDPQVCFSKIRNFSSTPWMSSLRDNFPSQIIRFTPVEAYYWDNMYNTMVPLLKSVA